MAPQLGQTQYYKLNQNGQDVYTTGSYGGNDPYGYQNVGKDAYIQGLQGQMGTAQSFLANYNPEHYSSGGTGYRNKYTGEMYQGNTYDQSSIDKLQQQIAAIQGGQGQYADNYVDPSFSKFQPNAPTPSEQYYTQDAFNSLAPGEQQRLKNLYSGSYANYGISAVPNGMKETKIGPNGSVGLVGANAPDNLPTNGVQTMNSPSSTVGSQLQAAGGTNSLTPGQSSASITGNLSDVQIAQKNALADANNAGASTSGATTTNNGTPTTPQTPTTPTQSSGNSYLDQVMALSKLSQGEIDAQQQLNQLDANSRQGQFNVSQQPIAQGFISGQQAAMQQQANIAKLPLQNQLALAQSQRQASLDAAKAGLEYTKPTSVGMGTNLVNPLTGETVAQGQSYSAKLGAANVLALSKTYPDAGILPSDDPDTAAQKASNAPSFIAKFGTQKYQFNPATGQFDLFNTNRLANTTPGSSYDGNPNGNGTATTSSGTSNSSSLGGFANVQAVKDFQSAHGLVADGIVGSKTKAAMQAAGMSVPTATSPSSSKSTSSNSTGFNLSVLSPGALNRLTTGDFRTGDKYSSQQNAIDAEIRKQFPNFNPQIAKGNAKAINDQIGSQADVDRAITAADDNFGLLTSTFKNSGVNNMESPVANNFANWLKGGVIGNQKVQTFQSGVSTLQTEYATVLGRGGEVTDSVRKSAQKVINGDYSMNDLVALHDYIDKEGKNVINSYTKEINKLVSGSGGSSSSSSSTSNGTTSSGINYTIQ